MIPDALIRTPGGSNRTGLLLSLITRYQTEPPMPPLTPDSKFKITFAGAFVVLAAVAGAAWKAQATLSAISKSLDDVSTRVSQVESAVNTKISGLELVMSDRWTKSNAAEWALRMVVANPGIKVPDPRNPAEFLNSGIMPGHTSTYANGANP